MQKSTTSNLWNLPPRVPSNTLPFRSSPLLLPPPLSSPDTFKFSFSVTSSPSTRRCCYGSCCCTVFAPSLVIGYWCSTSVEPPVESACFHACSFFFFFIVLHSLYPRIQRSIQVSTSFVWQRESSGRFISRFHYSVLPPPSLSFIPFFFFLCPRRVIPFLQRNTRRRDVIVIRKFCFYFLEPEFRELRPIIPPPSPEREKSN